MVSIALDNGFNLGIDLIPTDQVDEDGLPVSLEVVNHLTIRRQSLAPKSGYAVFITITKGSNGQPFVAALSSSMPVYNTASDPICQNEPERCPMNLNAGLNSDSVLTLVVDPMVLHVVTVESVAIIKSAYADTVYIPPSGGFATLQTQIQNMGGYAADYVETVSNCSMYVSDTVMAQSVGLHNGELGRLNFAIPISADLKTPVTHHCLVSLSSPTGKLYDSVAVMFDTTNKPPNNP
jgi:hypothetical protein